MDFPYVTAVLAAFLIILQQFLMIAVGLHRTQQKQGIGIGVDPLLEMKVRRHGNLAENSALFLVVLAITELMGASHNVVVGFAALFAVCRIFHAVGFSNIDGAQGNLEGNKFFLILRVLGATGTGWGGIGLGGYLAYQLTMA